MAKEYFLQLNGRARPLRYTRQERIEIERRFDCDVRDFIYKMCFPIENGVPTGGGRLECQEALIWYGLRHNGPKVTEGYVSQELQKLGESGKSLYEPLSQAILALLASGVLGYTPPLPEDEEESEGKGEAKAETGKTS